MLPALYLVPSLGRCHFRIVCVERFVLAYVPTNTTFPAHKGIYHIVGCQLHDRPLRPRTRKQSSMSRLPLYGGKTPPQQEFYWECGTPVHHFIPLVISCTYIKLSRTGRSRFGKSGLDLISDLFTSSD
jgi:hypothetical protein